MSVICSVICLNFTWNMSVFLLSRIFTFSLKFFMVMIVLLICSCYKQTFLRQKVTLASSPPASGGGVLRYALHARFVCPLPKKNSRSLQRCKSDPSYAPTRNDDIDGERRFYLYNDLRVVFPQRHSDADEGKVCHIYCFFLVTLL